jgi:hypothetical protein
MATLMIDSSRPLRWRIAWRLTGHEFEDEKDDNNAERATVLN